MGALNDLEIKKQAYQRSQGIDRKKFNAEVALKIHKKKQKAKKNKAFHEVIRCDCGQVINIHKPKTLLKCFRCNHIYDKINGVWVKSDTIIKKDQMTIADLSIRVRDMDAIKIRS